MFGLFANKLTAVTGNVVDFSRVGAFVRSGNHKYTTEELAIRASIASITVASACLAYYANNQTKNSSLLSNMLVIVLGAGIGLASAHIPLGCSYARKRVRMKKQFKAMVEEINLNAVKFEIPGESLKYVISELENCSLATENHSNASQTLGRQLKILTQLNQVVVEHGKDTFSIQSLFDKLLSKDILQSVFKEEITLNLLLAHSLTFNDQKVKLLKI